MYFYPGKTKTFVRGFNKSRQELFLSRQITLPGIEEIQSQQIGGKKRTARNEVRTARIFAAESACNLDFFGLPAKPVFLRALVLAARMTPVYRNFGS